MSSQEDSWSVEKNYSRDQTFTRASDKKGHYERLPEIKMHPAFVGFLGRAISQQRYGAAFGCMQDFQRDCMYHGVAYYEDKINNGWIPPKVATLFAIARAEEFEAKVAEQEQLKESMTRVVDLATKNGTVASLADAADILDSGMEGAEGPILDELVGLKEKLDLYRRRWIK